MTLTEVTGRTTEIVAKSQLRHDRLHEAEGPKYSQDQADTPGHGTDPSESLDPTENQNDSSNTAESSSSNQEAVGSAGNQISNGDLDNGQLPVESFVEK